MYKKKNKYIDREVLKRIVGINSFLLKSLMPPAEKYSISGKIQPVYIIGSPRTGSSILYQTLTQKLDVVYIDNLADIFHANILLGISLSSWLYKNRPHNCFKSIEGDTWAYGLHAPSESWDFWYQYLPRDRHFIDYNDFNEDIVLKFQKQIFSVIKKFEKPLLFKNLNAGQRLRLLSKVSPKGKFIYIQRNFLDTAFSILNSRKKLGIKDNEWWSVKPKDYKSLIGENVYELITNQIFHLEKQIVDDLSLFNSDQVITINYKDLYENYNRLISELSEFIGAAIKNYKDLIEPELKSDIKKERNKKEEEMFLKYYERYDWDKTNVK